MHEEFPLLFAVSLFINEFINSLMNKEQQPRIYRGLAVNVHTKSIFIITENYHAGETFMLAPTFYLGPAVPPPRFVYSRIATAWEFD